MNSVSLAVAPSPDLESEFRRGGPYVDRSGIFTHHGLWGPGVRAFRSLRFAAKALIISLAFVLPMIGLIAWLLVSEAESSMQAHRDATRQHVEIAHGIVTWAHAQETSGRMSREQAQLLARQTIASLRYDGNEYFWINDMQPRMVMHAVKPELDGKDLGGMKDPNGFALFNAFVAKVRQDGKGFVAYQWPKPGSQAPVDKLSYVQGFEPWGWVIGSSIYIEDVRSTLVEHLVWVGAVVALALLVAGYLFLSFYRVMDGGLKETRRHLRAMTDGDLTTSPSPWGSDEAAQLMLELRNMQESLRSMVRRVRHSSDRIVSTSAAIAAGAMDLSGRTEQAAANLEQSAAAMEQLSSNAASTAASTHEASDVARRNADAAAGGGRQMQDVIRTMDAIQSSSARIGDIIGTSVDQTRNGTEIVRRTGATIDEIVASSQRVNTLLGQVATGARDQSQGISQIGQAVQDLDKMTQQNATLVEQTAAAAAAMREQAGTLAGEVARFQLQD